ncbi:MAG TPA: VOC family protein [Acidimicrobiales bacterium]|nr:VOC family protein [Acidimicrobiales bacterium]
MTHRLVRLDHVQLAIPERGEPAADEFWSGLLGLEVVPKPPAMAARGGRWYEGRGLAIHVGVDPDFRPARKAHPALVVDGLDDLVTALAAGGHPVRWDDEQPGVRRCFVDDPFGNRVELVDAGAS